MKESEPGSGPAGQIYKVEHISKVFGKCYVFNDVSFEINQGEIFGIIGTSGSGKTTLLNILVGFLKVEKGDVLFRNVNLLNAQEAQSFRSIYKHQKELKRLYGFAAQVPSFYPNLTVKENIYYFGFLYDLSKELIKSNADHLLNLVGLAQSQHIIAKNLSGGMQRRLDIACSLIHDPKVLLLDEPTADLDPMLSNKIWNLLRIINQRGTTIIIASHHIVELEQLCNRIAIIKDGNIIALGKPEDIKSKNNPEDNVYIKSSPGDYKQIIARMKRISKEIKGYQIKNKALVIPTHQPPRVIHAALKAVELLGEKIISMEIIKPTLDQTFIAINEETPEKKDSRVLDSKKMKAIKRFKRRKRQKKNRTRMRYRK